MTRIKSIIKAFSILNLFTPDQTELTTSYIASELDMPLPTVSHILSTLCYLKVLERNGNNHRYKIGTSLYFLGNLYLNATDLSKVTDPVAEVLNSLNGESVNLGILEKSYIVIILRKEARHIYRTGRNVGSFVPAYASSMGRALLSELRDTEIDMLYPNERLEPMTENTVPDKASLKLILEQIRKTGISIDKEEAFEGIEGIASIIRDYSGKAVAAMNFGGLLAFRMTDDYRAKLGELIKRGCSLISYRLGYQNPHNKIREIEDLHIKPLSFEVSVDSRKRL